MSRNATFRLAVSIALLLAVSIAVSGCGSGSPSTPAATSSASTPAEQPASTSGSSGAASAPVKVGEKATSGDWALVVKGVEFAPAAGGAKAAAPNTLAVVTMDVTNTSTSGQGIGPSSFKLAGADGTAYQATPTSDKAFIFNTEQPIKGGETRTVKIAYSVPEGVKAFKLTFAPFDPAGKAQPAVIEIQ
jgi:hypothetical protein